MEVTHTSELHTVFPSFVLQKHWDMPDEFNTKLYELAQADWLKNNVDDVTAPDAVGIHLNYIAHKRHNFLMDTVDPIIPQFMNMVAFSVREYLWQAFNYKHEGEISMMGDTFYQRKEHDENYGVPMHRHTAHEVVCTYYPHVEGPDPDDYSMLQTGAVRFFDPTGVSRLWPTTNRKDMNNGRTHMVQPKKGSMVVFEGHMPHDSTFFNGENRMCIPVMCRLVMENSHNHKTTQEILEVQNNGN